MDYLAQLSRLVVRRITNSLRIKLAYKPHRGLKRWPDWLSHSSSSIRTNAVCELCLPVYLQSTQTIKVSEVSQLHFDARDTEAYFASHRWGSCLVAALLDSAVAATALEEALSWIRNPPSKKDAAWETYSSCERTVNLLVMLAVHQSLWRTQGSEVKVEVFNFLRDSATWIFEHLEYYGINNTNNHILNNARAMIIAGVAIGDKSLVESGLIVFSRMAKVLFQKGGFLRERSSHYQCIVTGWLMDALHFARSVSIGSPQARIALSELEDLSTRVTEATGLLIEAIEGLNTHIGDISPDNHPTVTTLRLRMLYSPLFKCVGTGSDEHKDDWLFVSSGKHQLLTCGMPAEYPFDYATHGHSDLGSFVWGYNHRPILVDAGRSSYVLNEITGKQCGSTGHNVLTVNGLSSLSESLLTNGNWRPRPYAGAEIIIKRKGSNGLVVSHNGFSRIPAALIQSRTIEIISNEIRVLDSLSGSDMVEIDMYWHFAPEASPHKTIPMILQSVNFQVCINEEGGDTVDMHWEEYPFSSKYGNVQIAYMLHTKRLVALPWSMTTILKVMECAE